MLLAGCARPETGPPVIKLATWFGTDEARQMQGIIDRINKRHHDFRVTLVTIPGGDYLTKIDTMMAGRVAPDLFLLSQEYIPSYASIGAIEDLDARIRHDKAIDLPDYYPAALQTASWHGHLYGLPITMMPVVLYYNKRLFDAAHEPYPTRDWDWARFREAAIRLTKRDAAGRYTQWGFVQADWPPLPIWIWQNGGHVMNAAGTQPTFGDPATVQALQFVQDLVVRDRVSPRASTVQQMGLDELFKSGRVAMFF
ncbi:MAG TPA: sugar ABC transporter substrate-binding protein, partial [Oscillatoriaceae cyanobacterium]